MSHQVEAVREECNKNIVVMAEEIKALETVCNILIANRTFHVTVVQECAEKNNLLEKALREKKTAEKELETVSYELQSLSCHSKYL